MTWSGAQCFFLWTNNRRTVLPTSGLTIVTVNTSCQRQVLHPQAKLGLILKSGAHVLDKFTLLLFTASVERLLSNGQMLSIITGLQWH